MEGYAKGTREQLNAAAEDATLIPFGTLFRVGKDGDYSDSAGLLVVRQENRVTSMCTETSVLMDYLGGYDFFDAGDLEPYED